MFSDGQSFRAHGNANCQDFAGMTSNRLSNRPPRALRGRQLQDESQRKHHREQNSPSKSVCCFHSPPCSFCSVTFSATSEHRLSVSFRFISMASRPSNLDKTSFNSSDLRSCEPKK